MEGGIRVIEKADLFTLAVVDRGAYPGSRLEARARTGKPMPQTKVAPIFDWQDPEEVAARWASGRPIPKRSMWARSTVPKTGGDCECVTKQPDTLYKVSFEPDAFDDLLGAIARKERDVILHTGRFDAQNSVASTSRGSLGFRKAADGGLDIAVFNPAAATPAGRSLAESLGSVPAYVRPLIRDIDADFLQDDVARTRVYQQVRQMSLLAKWDAE